MFLSTSVLPGVQEVKKHINHLSEAEATRQGSDPHASRVMLILERNVTENFISPNRTEKRDGCSVLARSKFASLMLPIMVSYSLC